LNLAQHVLICAVRLYRWTLSPAKGFFFGPACGCRFEPSCSAYALRAVREHGALAGSWLALKRLARCHPWGGCGPDPVPAKPAGCRNRSIPARPSAAPQAARVGGGTPAVGRVPAAPAAGR